ncbi:acyltransferase family protein [Thermodesulfobacteriota bacterium]
MARLRGVDGIRSIACLLIVFHHLSQRLPHQTHSPFFGELQSIFLKSAQAGVSVFFVLSGMLLSLPFWQRYLNNDAMPGLKVYTVRRAARIMPAFYLILIVSFIMEAFFPLGQGYTIERIVSAFTFTSCLHYTTLFPIPINGPLWTISLEVFSYLLLPLFMIGMFALPVKRKFYNGFIFWIIALAFVFFVNSLILTHLQPDDINRGWRYGVTGGAKSWVPYVNPISFFAHFALGIFASVFIVLIDMKNELRARLGRLKLFDIMAATGFAFFFLILWTQRDTPYFSFSFQHQLYNYPYLAASVALILAFVPYSTIISKILDNRFFRFTAKISFGLYLWHLLIINIINRFFAPEYKFLAFLTPDSAADMDRIGRWFGLSVIAVVTTYIIAAISWYVLEKPILERVHKKRLKQTNISRP